MYCSMISVRRYSGLSHQLLRSVRSFVRPSVSYKIHEMNYIAVAPHSGSLYIPSKTVSAFCCIIASNSTYLVSQQSKHDFGSTYLPMNLLSRGMEFMSCRFSTHGTLIPSYTYIQYIPKIPAPYRISFATYVIFYSQTLLRPTPFTRIVHTVLTYILRNIRYLNFNPA